MNKCKHKHGCICKEYYLFTPHLTNEEVTNLQGDKLVQTGDKIVVESHQLEIDWNVD